MKKLLFILLACAASASSGCAEQTALSTVVPSEHTVTLVVGEHGAAAAGSRYYTGNTALAVSRFGSLTLQFVPDPGYRLDQVHTSSAHNLTLDGDTVILSSAVQDLTLEASFVETGDAMMRLRFADLVLSPGMSLRLEPEFYPAPSELPAVSWSTSNADAASVSKEGVVTAVKSGSAVISAISAGFSADCSVRVRNMNTLTLPSQLTVIEAQAFRDNTSLEIVRLPSGVEHVEARAFAGCANLRFAYLPASVRSIGEDCFAGCEHLIIFCPGDASAVIDYAKAHRIPCVPY